MSRDSNIQKQKKTTPLQDGHTLWWLRKDEEGVVSVTQHAILNAVAIEIYVPN